MRYLVTGGTGFLGRFVARELKLRGHSATFLTRKKTAVDHLEADLTAWDAGLDIKNLKGQYDILLHMAGLYNLRVSEDDAVLSNVIGTHTALTLAEKAEIDRTYVSRLENGRVDVSVAVAYKVAIALNTNLAQIIKESEKSL